MRQSAVRQRREATGPATEARVRSTVTIATELVFYLRTADTACDFGCHIPRQVWAGRPRCGDRGSAVCRGLETVVDLGHLEGHRRPQAHQARLQVDGQPNRVWT